MMEELVVSGDLNGQEKQGQHGNGQLEEFRAAFLCGERAPAPGGCRAAAESFDTPQGGQIPHGTEQRQQHHGDTYGGDVHAVGDAQRTGGRSECTDADQQAHAAEGDEGAANALQHSEENRRPIQKF